MRNKQDERSKRERIFLKITRYNCYIKLALTYKGSMTSLNGLISTYILYISEIMYILNKRKKKTSIHPSHSFG